MFKNRVQNLIDHNILSFTKEKLIVKPNNFPNHGNHTVNAIIEENNT